MQEKICFLQKKGMLTYNYVDKLPNLIIYYIVQCHTLGSGSVVRAPAAQAECPGFDPRQLPWVFFFDSIWLTNVDGMIEGSMVL